MKKFAIPRGLPPLLEPFRATSADRWDQRKVCHLYRRAGFGPTLAEMEQGLALGKDGTVDRLLHRADSGELDRFLSIVQTELVDFGDDIARAQAFWLYRMVATQDPFPEKMALFWHGHFATANYKVRNPALMYGQYETLREHGRGDFETLLREVARDPAMLIWLDGGTSRRQSPNENFARELLELFTMGPGAYSEDDVRNAARAFTGWRVQGGRAVFSERQCDAGDKTFLGAEGPLGADEIIRIVSYRAETARFLARALLAFFVADDVPADVVEGLTQVYLQNRGNVLAVMDVIFRSRLFYSREVYRGLVKSPVELVVGTVRVLDANTNRDKALPALANMGQELFNPPSVKGWEGGEKWLNTVTSLERANFVSDMMLRTPVKVAGRDHVLLQSLKDHKLRAPAEVVDHLVRCLVQGDVSPRQRRTFEEYYASQLAEVDAGKTDEAWDFKLRRLSALIMTLPAYQLS